MQLAVTAAMEAASVEAGSAAESTTTANYRSSATNRGRAVKTACDVTRAAIEPTASKSPVSPELGRVTPVVPRTGADEDPAHEIVRAVETIRRTGIRSVIVISVRAHRRSGGDVARSNSDAYSDSNLRLRIRQRQHQHGQQSKIL